MKKRTGVMIQGRYIKAQGTQRYVKRLHKKEGPEREEKVLATRGAVAGEPL